MNSRRKSNQKLKERVGEKRPNLHKEAWARHWGMWSLTNGKPDSGQTESRCPKSASQVLETYTTISLAAAEGFYAKAGFIVWGKIMEGQGNGFDITNKIKIQPNPNVSCRHPSAWDPDKIGLSLHSVSCGKFSVLPKMCALSQSSYFLWFPLVLELVVYQLTFQGMWPLF